MKKFLEFIGESEEPEIPEEALKIVGKLRELELEYNSSSRKTGMGEKGGFKGNSRKTLIKKIDALKKSFDTSEFAKEWNVWKGSQFPYWFISYNETNESQVKMTSEWENFYDELDYHSSDFLIKDSADNVTIDVKSLFEFIQKHLVPKKVNENEERELSSTLPATSLDKMAKEMGITVEHLQKLIDMLYTELPQRYRKK
jgi:hypothetical protein